MLLGWHVLLNAAGNGEYGAIGFTDECAALSLAPSLKGFAAAKRHVNLPKGKGGFGIDNASSKVKPDFYVWLLPTPDFSGYCINLPMEVSSISCVLSLMEYL